MISKKIIELLLNEASFSLTELQLAMAHHYCVTVTVQSPRWTTLTGDAAIDIRVGISDKKVRLFQGKISLGEVSPEFAFEEALKLASHKYSQKVFNNQLAVAKEGESD